MARVSSAKGSSKSTQDRDNRVNEFAKFGEVCGIRCAKCMKDRKECVWYFGEETKCAACVKLGKPCGVIVDGKEQNSEDYWIGHTASTTTRPKQSTLDALLAKGKRGPKRKLSTEIEVRTAKRTKSVEPARIEKTIEVESNEDSESESEKSESGNEGKEVEWDDFDRMLAEREEDWEKELEDSEVDDNIEAMVTNLRGEVIRLDAEVKVLNGTVEELQKQIQDMKREREQEMEEMKNRMMKLARLIKK